MAQSVFDAFVGVSSVENGAYLAVQSLLDGHSIQVQEPASQHSLQPEDDDVFQCGRCKRQFTSLSSFVNHKQNCSSIQHSQGQHMLEPLNTQQLQSQHGIQHLYSNGQGDIMTSTVSQLAAGIVMSDDMVPLTLEASSSASLHTTGHVHSNNYLAQTSVTVSLPHTVGTHYNHNLTTSLPGQFQLAVLPNTGSETLGAVSLNSQHSGSEIIGVLVGRDSGYTNAITSQGYIIQHQPQTVAVHSQQNQMQHLHIQAEQTQLLQVPQGTEQSETSAANTKRRGRRPGVNKQALCCQWCKKSFTKRFDLEQHIRAHTGEKPFQCVVCGRSFSQKANVKKHMQTHKVWPIKAPTLPEQPVPQVVVYREKQDGASNEPSSTSNTQNNENSLLSSASLDVNSISEAPSIAAEEGQSQTGEKSSGETQATEKLHFLVDSSYVCPYCPDQMRFDTFYKLRSHLTIHKADQMVYKCIKMTCNETFQDLDEFLEHIKIHENDMKYRCHICNEEFESLDDLGKHQYSHSLNTITGELDKRRRTWRGKCMKCGNIYSSPEALRHHMETSTHNHPCPHCDKVFACERLLRRHLAHHTDGVYKCKKCQRTFKSEYYLKAHDLIHTGEKPFSCEKCGMKFNRKDKVKRHMLTHESVKRFVCPFKDIIGCDKAFARPDKLKEHLHKHKSLNTLSTTEKTSGHSILATSSTGELVVLTPSAGNNDELLCRFCKACRFENKSHKKSHELLCSRIPRERCEHCDLTYNDKVQLEGHVCRQNIESVHSLVKVNKYKKKRKLGRPSKADMLARKKSLTYRVELSPPPVRKSHRGARSRLRHSSPTLDCTEEDNIIDNDLSDVGQNSQMGNQESSSSNEKPDFLTNNLNLDGVGEQQDAQSYD